MDAPPAEIVRRLLKVVGRELPVSAAKDLLAPDLHSHMDGKLTARGSGAWFRWVRFLHRNAEKQFSGFGAVVENVSENGGVVLARAKWRGVRKGGGGQTEFSPVCEASYEVRGGRISKIWTKRKNYVFIYGRNIARFRPAFWFLLLRLACRRAPPETPQNGAGVNKP